MVALLHTLSEPWSEPVMRHALLEASLLGICGGLLGPWLVLHRLAYPTESLAHGLLPGLVAASFVGAPLLLGGAAGLAVAAVGVGLAARVSRVDRDGAVAAVVTGLLGLGVLLGLAPSAPAGIESLLFGDILGVTDGDLWAAGGLAVVLCGALYVGHGRMVAVGFDRAAAPALGIGAARVDLALLALLAATLLVAVQGLGNLLVVAILLAPAGAARALTRRVVPLLAVSTAVAIAGAAAGLYLSYYARTAAGASIAATLAAAFLLARLTTYHRTA